MSTRATCTAVLVLLGITSSAAFATDRYVARFGRDKARGIPNGCADVATPCKSLDRALVAAGSGDVINVAGGKHRSRIVVDWSTDLTFLGGWDPTFTTRDPALYPTVFLGRSRRTPTGADKRVFTIIAGDGETITVAIDGITLTMGKARRLIDFFDVFALGQDGGGGLAALAGPGGSITLAVRRSTIGLNRSAVKAGGGVFIGASGSDSSVAATFDGVALTANQADYAGAVELLSCGGVSCNAALTMTNCVVTANKAEGAAAIHALGSGVTLNLVNTTITANHGDTEAGEDPEGALVVGAGAVANLENTILWGNDLSPPALGADLLLGPATVNVDHCDLGSVDPSVGVVNDLGGNLNVDPQLSGVALTAGSPLVDSGTCVGAPPLDFGGDPRPSGSGCDIGADELGS